MIKLGLLLTLLSIETYGASIDITSFRRTDSQSTRDTSAEICASVTEVSYPTIVTVTADPGANPGNYHVTLPAPGDFCLVISTFYGRAEIKVGETTAKINSIK